MSDPTLPSLPPPPPPSVPPPPFAPAPEFGYPSTAMGPPANTPRKSRAALWIGLGVVAALAVGAAIWAGASSSDSKDNAEVASSVASSVPLPSEGVEVTGESGWAMTIDPDWDDFDFGSADVEAGWTTGGGDDTFRSNVNVVVEIPTVAPGLDTYMALSATNIPDQLTGAVVMSTEVLAVGDQEYGRIEYSASMSDIDGHFVAYVVNFDGKFVIVTFATTSDLFAAEAPDVEPFLATLREQ